MPTDAQPSAPSLKLALCAILLIAITHIIGVPLAFWEKSYPFEHTGHVIFMTVLFSALSSGYCVLFYAIYKAPPASSLTPTTRKRTTTRKRSAPKRRSHGQRGCNTIEPVPTTWHERLLMKGINKVLRRAVVTAFVIAPVTTILLSIISALLPKPAAEGLMRIPGYLFCGALAAILLVFVGAALECLFFSDAEILKRPPLKPKRRARSRKNTSNYGASRTADWSNGHTDFGYFDDVDSCSYGSDDSSDYSSSSGDSTSDSSCDTSDSSSSDCSSSSSD